jgi:starch synthase
MKVLAVASEVFPLIKTGGLADVVGALPGALAAHGVEVRTIVPGYRAVMAAMPGAPVAHTFPDLMGGPARLRAGIHAGLAVFFLDAPHLYDREGGPYGGLASAWPDNPQRFAALCQAAAAIGRGAVADWRPDLVHAHDWQAGLTPAYLKYDGGPPMPTVFTVHNLAFQGWCPADLLGVLGLPAESFDIEGVEFFGGIGTLKAGLRLADRITTVSPTYAAEILQPESGQALDGLLRSRATVLSGIVNGIDTAVWNPATDPLLATRFNAPDGRRLGRNKATLQAQFGLAPAPDALVFGIVSRLTDQKGIDLVLEALPTLLALGGQLAVLGSGDAALQAAMRAAAVANPGRVGVRIGYDEGQAHLVQAGCDALLAPSRFEPCGLTQLCALRYGAIPVVSRVGGLADTVIDANLAGLSAGVATGVQFLPVTASGLENALRRTAALFADKRAWAQMQPDVGWAGPAAEYAALYRDAAELSGPGRPAG